MAYWDDNAAAAANLRLYVPGAGWRSYVDKIDADEKVEAAGCRRQIESIFLNALNATNLVILTGSGSSFAAKNVDAPGQPAKLSPASMKDLWNAVKARVGDGPFAAILARFPNVPVGENIEKLLTICKLYLELNESADDDAFKATKKFVGDAELAILERVNFVDADTALEAHAALITKVGRRGVRKPRTKVFTTNYDLCFEEAARRHRFSIIDGFSHALDQVYDAAHFSYDIVRRDALKDAPDYIENVFHLYKLHGSIDWRRTGSDVVRSRGPKGSPVLIYPRSSKYQESYDAPYLDMMGALQTALREPDTAVLISGFGFNDDHLSRPILSAIETNMSLRLVICDPGFLEAADLDAADHDIGAERPTDNRFLKAFHSLADAGDARVHLMSGRFSDLAMGLPDLVGETDRERHAARIRALRDGGEA